MAMNNDDDGLASVDVTVVADPSDYETFVAVFARTYSHSEDPAAVVDLYHDYQQLRAKHPNAGSGKLSTKLGVSRSNIRKWVDNGAVPYVVQGLQTAETRGWIPMQFDSETFRAINQLIAWVISSGSIHAERWSVQFVVDDEDDRARLETLLVTLGLKTVEPDNPGTGLRGTVLSPTPDGSVLGRVLYSLGAPTGAEKRDRDVELPPYLQNAPARIRREWLLEYLRNRERSRDTEKQWISFTESRPSQYKREFVALVEDVTGADASTSGTDIYIGAEAVAALQRAAERYEQLQSDSDPLPLVTRDAFLETFSNQHDTAERLQQYREFEAADGYWTNVAREQDIPMSRAQRWDNGGKPAFVPAVDVAEENGWFADEWTETVDALATLVIGTHAAGYIHENYAPEWRLGGDSADAVRAALDTVGVGATHRNDRLVPATDGAPLGRALVVAGGFGDAQNRRFPGWLFLVSPERREEYLRLFLAERITQYTDRSPSQSLKLDRPQSYFIDLSVLIEAVTGVDAPVHEGRITVPADAIRALDLA